MLYGFENPWSALGMPAFDTASEFLAGVEYSVVVILVVDRSCEAVAKHAFGEGRQRVDGVFL